MDAYHFFVFVGLRTFDELFFLAPIDEGRKSGDDQDGEVNGGAIKPG